MLYSTTMTRETTGLAGSKSSVALSIHDCHRACHLGILGSRTAKFIAVQGKTGIEGVPLASYGRSSALHVLSIQHWKSNATGHACMIQRKTQTQIPAQSTSIQSMHGTKLKPVPERSGVVQTPILDRPLGPLHSCAKLRGSYSLVGPM